jgi:hypothetical protein
MRLRSAARRQRALLQGKSEALKLAIDPCGESGQRYRVAADADNLDTPLDVDEQDRVDNLTPQSCWLAEAVAERLREGRKAVRRWISEIVVRAHVVEDAWFLDLHVALAVTVPNFRPARIMIMRSAPVWISECTVRTS